MPNTIADNSTSLWVKLLLIVSIVVAITYALPNIYKDDPALQISGSNASSITQKELNKLISELREAGIEPLKTDINTNNGLIRFTSTDDQLKAYALLADTQRNNYSMALNLASNVPEWLRSISAMPMFLGLDLRGGVHFLMEVDIESFIKNDLENIQQELKSVFRAEKLRYKSIKSNEKNIVIVLRNANDFDKAVNIALDKFTSLELAEEDSLASAKNQEILLQYTQKHLKDSKEMAIKQNITTLRNRTNELGISEPIIQKQGEARIIVELPGVLDTVRAKEILGATASLEFRMVAEVDHARARRTGISPPGTKLYPSREGEPLALKNTMIIAGDNVVNAASSIEQNTGSPIVSVTLDSVGGDKMLENTKKNINKRMAVVFVETKIITQKKDGQKIKTRTVTKEIINASVIREQFSNRFQISGMGTTNDARNLALLLRAGSLAAPMEIVEERTIGPSLGQDNISKGFQAVVIGFILVLIFMLIRYKLFGLIANFALTLNLVFIVAILSILQATLTLPGIAGIVLTIGMAVDANVLIFERIKEEMKAGSRIQEAIYSGYNKAFITIADANITTLIAAIILFIFGTGPIKGFAITLAIGIVTSMFTAILASRAIVNQIYGNKKVHKLSI